MNLMNTLITRLHWQRIHCYHIFGIMVRYFHQVAKFAPDGGIIIQHISNLNVNALIAALRHEINLLAMGIPHVNRIIMVQKMQKTAFSINLLISFCILKPRMAFRRPKSSK